MSQPSEPFTPPLPTENVRRGILFALPALPIGVLAWVLLWSVGFIAAILALGISLGAFFLYRTGSGGRIGRAGASTVTAITIVGIAASFVIGFQLHARDTVPTQVGEVVVTVVLAVVFGALGCYAAWRTAVVQDRVEEQATRKPLPGFENGTGKDTW